MVKLTTAAVILCTMAHSTTTETGSTEASLPNTARTSTLTGSLLRRLQDSSVCERQDIQDLIDAAESSRRLAPTRRLDMTDIALQFPPACRHCVAECVEKSLERMDVAAVSEQQEELSENEVDVNECFLNCGDTQEEEDELAPPPAGETEQEEEEDSDKTTTSNPPVVTEEDEDEGAEDEDSSPNESSSAKDSENPESPDGDMETGEFISGAEKETPPEMGALSSGVGCADRSRTMCNTKPGCTWKGVRGCRRGSDNGAGQLVPPAVVAIFTTLALFSL